MSNKNDVFNDKFDFKRVATVTSQIINNDKNNANPEPSVKESIVKKSHMKSLRRNIKSSYYKFVPYLGNITLAKIHREANSPLKKIAEFDDKSEFCECCGNPRLEEGIIEKFKYSDSTDDFIQNGQAIPLYFSFYLYSIFILTIIFLSVSLPCLLISYNTSKELNKVCNESYEKAKIKDECKIYLDNSDNIEDENKSSFNFILDFSGLNIKNFRKIHEKLTKNKNKNIDNIFVNFSVLNFIGIWTILLIYLGYIILINNKAHILDIDILSPKNYSIMITGMDGFFSYLKKKTNFLSIMKQPEANDKKENELNQPSERELNDEKTFTGVKMFENLFKEKISELFLNEKKVYDIKKVNICFKINKYIELEEKYEKCEEMSLLKYTNYQEEKNKNVMKSQQCYYYSPFSDFNIHICEKKKKISDIKKEKRELEKKIEDLLEERKEITMEKFAGAVIVSFNTIKEKEEFLSNIPNSLFIQIVKYICRLRYFFCFCCIDKIDNSNFVMKHLKIKIAEAPNPKDIIFENLEFTQREKTYRVVGINMISLILIGIGFVAILGLQYLQMYVNKKDYNKIIYYIISLCITIVSSIINIIFEELLDILTKHEKQNSIGNYYLSYSIKLTIFSFAIKGIIPLVVEEILGTTNYEILITNMLTMFLVNSVLSPLIWTLNISPIYWIKKLEIHLIEKDKKKYLNFNQKKLNEIYEKCDMNIAEKYSYIARTILMTFLYISIFPFGVLISLGGFILSYFLEKYNFINNYKRPQVLNNNIFFFYIKNYVIFIFLIGIGDYIFLSDVLSNKGWSLVNLVFSGILIVIPFNYFLNLDFIGFNEREINKKTYEDLYLDFDHLYERINPMTKIEGDKEFLEKMYEKGKITKEEKDNYLENIKKINLMNIYYQNRKKSNMSKIHDNIISIYQSPLSKSFFPNQQNALKLSCLNKSSIEKNNKEQKKKFGGLSQNLNQLNSLKQFKDKSILIVNNEENKKETKKQLEVKNPIKEEMDEENFQEDEKESGQIRLDSNNLSNKKKKKLEGKSVKFNIKKSHYEKPDFNRFYQDPVKFKLYESMQLHELMTKKDDELFGPNIDEDSDENDGEIQNYFDNMESFDSNNNNEDNKDI